MNSMQKYNQILYYVLFLTIVSFYSFGNFGFLNIFDIKREFQFILLLIILPISLLIVIQNIKKLVYEPLFILLVYLFVASLFVFSSNKFILFTNLLSIFFVGVLLSVKKNQLDFIIKGIVILCTIFSLMGILQFILMQLDKELIFEMSMEYQTTTGSKGLSHTSLIEYLGFVVTNPIHHAFGIDFYRLKSFASEPSALVYSFFIPGLLSFFYKGWFKLYGIIIIFFSIFLVASGVIYLSILLGSLFILFLKFFKISPKKMSFIIILSVILIFVLIAFVDLLPLLHFLAPSKMNSGNIRLTSISTVIHNIINNPLFCVNGCIPMGSAAIGFVLKSASIIPLLGLYFVLRLFYKLFINITIVVTRTYYYLIAGLIAGSIIQMMFFSAFGWTTISGYIMLAIIYIKMQELAYEVKKYEKS